MNRLLTIFALTTITTASATAQRGEPSLAIGGGELAFDHGRPPFGRHSLDELPVGERWRLGSNEATTFVTDVPVLGGGELVAPGAYRVQLYRETNERFALQVDYAAWALADGREAREAVYLRSAKLVRAEPTKALEIAMTPRPGEGEDDDDASRHELAIDIRFGPHHLEVPCAAIAKGGAHKLRGYRVDWFAIPADLFEQRQRAGRGTVIASLHPRKAKKSGKIPPFHNVVVVGDSVRLVPALRAPVGSFGFEALRPFEAAWTTETQLTWQKSDAEHDTVRVTDAKLSRRALTVQLSVGARATTMQLEVPRGPR